MHQLLLKLKYMVSIVLPFFLHVCIYIMSSSYCESRRHTVQYIRTIWFILWEQGRVVYRLPQKAGFGFFVFPLRGRQHKSTENRKVELSTLNIFAENDSNRLLTKITTINYLEMWGRAPQILRSFGVFQPGRQQFRFPPGISSSFFVPPWCDFAGSVFGFLGRVRGTLVM